MKLIIQKYAEEEKYYIILDRDVTWNLIDYEIAEFLDISYDVFNSILSQFNVINVDYINSIGFEFHTKEDAESVIKKLEPYLIMKILIE